MSSCLRKTDTECGETCQKKTYGGSNCECCCCLTIKSTSDIKRCQCGGCKCCASCIKSKNDGQCTPECGGNCKCHCCCASKNAK